MSELERMIEENISLKKTLQLSRNTQDQLQMQLREVKADLESSQTRCSALSNDFCTLQKKHQNAFVEHTKGVNSLISQVDQLKNLVQEKQREIQTFQIKMIPDLDQDMMRVKLISQMQGPYQETINKKDQQIEHLKDSLSKLQRKYSLLNLTLETKMGEMRRELKDCKTYYTAENEKLMKEVSHLVVRKQVKSLEKVQAQAQRREIEELRSTLQFQLKNQTELRNEIMELKMEREKLLVSINSLHQANALKMHLEEKSGEAQKVKQEIKMMEEDLVRAKDQIARLQKQIKVMERDSKKTEDQYRGELTKLNSNFEAEREQLLNQLRGEKDEVRRLLGYKDRLQLDIEASGNMRKQLERDIAESRNECSKLKKEIEISERSIKELHEKKQKIQLSKDLIEAEEIRNQQKKKAVQISKENEDFNRKRQEKQDDYVKGLQQKILKLTEKLQYANKKIVQLLKAKVEVANVTDTNRKGRATSYMQTGTKRHRNALLLEHRDTGFHPLMIPTIYKLKEPGIRQVC